MSRILSLLLFIGLSSIPAVTFAQTCTPHCAPGTHCTYVGTDDSPSNPTTCVTDAQDGTVDELVVTAAGPARLDFAGFVDELVQFVDTYIIPLLYALAFIIFLIGVVRYFFTGGEENRQKARPFILWGLAGLVLIFGIWGVVNLLLSVLPGV